ncbi:cysteine hydrolase [Myxococcota bacterium]|nr:cysteine hydrolase [Myxococcota bacterium]
MEYLRSNARIRHRIPFKTDDLALLVIDAQKAFLSPVGSAFLASSTVIKMISQYVDFAQKQGIPIIFTRHAHDSSDDGGMMSRFYNGLIREGSTDSELLDIFSGIESCKTIKKKSYDAFRNTELLEYLTKKSIKRLLVCGVVTHLCVETTCRSAFMEGFEVFIAVDGCASYTETLHLASLLSLCDAAAIPVSQESVTGGSDCLT